MKESVIGTRIITQIGFLVRDAEATAKAYAEFFGVEYSTGATPAPEMVPANRALWIWAMYKWNLFSLMTSRAFGGMILRKMEKGCIISHFG